MALERVAARWEVPLPVIGSARRGCGRVGPAEIILADPLAWMNQSGPAVKILLDDYQLSPPDLIVIHDDLDLAVGRLRIKRRGGSGGHNGILSLVTALQTEEFCRLKIGVGRPAPGVDAADHVLSAFTPDEMALVDVALDRAVLALEAVLLEGVEIAMNRFHVRDQDAQG
jgi:PTH1 family peptidyl-tRNA hydrolase